MLYFHLFSRRLKMNTTERCRLKLMHVPSAAVLRSSVLLAGLCAVRPFANAPATTSPLREAASAAGPVASISVSVAAAAAAVAFPRLALADCCRLPRTAAAASFFPLRRDLPPGSKEKFCSPCIPSTGGRIPTNATLTLRPSSAVVFAQRGNLARWLPALGFAASLLAATSSVTVPARCMTSHKMQSLRPLSPTLSVKMPAPAADITAAAGTGEAAASTTVQIPRLLYGTAWKEDRTEDLVYQALKEGFLGVDTACQPKHYNEPGVGRGIVKFLRDTRKERDSLFIQTKFTPVDGHDHTQPLPYGARAPVAEQVRQSIQVSLHNLQCDYLDSVLLHSPLPSMEQTLEAWRSLEAAAGPQGKIRLLGISNCYDVFTLRNLYVAAKVKPALLQNRFYLDTGYDTEVRDFCEQHGIIYEAFWTLSANPHILRSDVVQRVAKRTASTPEQVWFRYLLDKGFVVLTGTKSVHHMRDDLQSLSIEFSRKDRLDIDHLIDSYI